MIFGVSEERIGLESRSYDSATLWISYCEVEACGKSSEESFKFPSKMFMVSVKVCSTSSTNSDLDFFILSIRLI